MITRKGFTLLEILIALLIFVILSIVTTTTLYMVFSSRDKVNVQADRLKQLQMALSIIERDIEQFDNRQVHVNQWQFKPSLIGRGDYLEFTRGGIFTPLTNKPHSSLQRIALLYKNHQLIRRTWPRLDTPNDENYSDKVLLDDINSFQFGYLDKNLTVLSEINNAALNVTQQQQKATPLPKAIQINLSFKTWGKMSLLFILPEGNYGAHDANKI